LWQPGGRQRTAHRRVDVTHHDDTPGAFAFEQELLISLQDLRGLGALRAAADSEVVVGP
jgi:hypothetical protein